MLWHDDEQKLVIELNKNKKSKFWTELWIENTNSFFAVWVDKKIYSKITWKSVLPKSDVIIIKNEKLDISTLEAYNYLLTDKMVDSLEWTIRLEKTWISVKKEWSNSFTITKMTPDTFYNIFNDYILWAWASIYSLREEELNKNTSVISWWKVKYEDFIKYFQQKNIINGNILTLQDYSNIKHYSTKTIESLIKNDSFINKYIFMWYWSFDEPYCCTYFYQDWILSKNVIIPFSVTTWSWRSKWDYTIVIKPR